jgi:predicted transposase YbfD/YdcC
MDEYEYSTVLEALTRVPDPRHARGKQLEWTMILGIIAGAIVSQQRSVTAMADWVRAHTSLLLTAFQPARGRLPSESTLRRALQHIDIRELEYHLAHVHPARQLPAEGVPLQGAAVDGKYVRGAGMHGQPTLLVSLVTHQPTRVLTQGAALAHQHESRAVAQLLTDRDLTGLVLTLDAGLAHPQLAAQIVRQGGHYLMVVKRNQARLYEDLTWYFESIPLPCDRPWRRCETVGKGHGRIEQRTLICTDDLDGYLHWPGVQQVIRRACTRMTVKTGKVTHAVTYALTSLPASMAEARLVEQLWRGHWAIENRVHYVRDVTMGEDAHQMHTGNAPQALAAIRNTVLNVLRARGWTNIAAALRHYSYSVAATLQLVGVRSC